MYGRHVYPPAERAAAEKDGTLSYEGNLARIDAAKLAVRGAFVDAKPRR